MTTAKLFLTAIVMLVLLAGCGGGGGGGDNTIPINPPPPTPVNRAPVITSLSPQGTSNDPVKIPVGAKQHIVVAASDPDKDPLSYSWSTTNGAITGSGAEADLSAPATPGTVIVTVKVSDDHKHTVTADCCFTVYKPNTPPPPPPPTNDPPVISSLVANPALVEKGGVSTITATVSDPDGDPLVYSWTCDGGLIESENGNVIVWKAPDTAMGCNITVSVSDGHNPAVSDSVSITVSGSSEPPIKNGLTAAYIQNSGVLAHPILANGTVVFTRIDPNINFDWERKAPDPLLVTLPETGNGHDFGVKWSGYIKCEKPGTYSFRARYDDGFRLWISNDSGVMQPVIDGWLTGPSIGEGQITLQGGKWHKLQAEYFEDEDRSYVQLYWLLPDSTTWAVIPTDALRTE